MVASFVLHWIGNIPVIFMTLKCCSKRKVLIIDRQIFNGFITYLLGHLRAISEVLNPRWKDISGLYANEFNGMTFDAVSLEELNAIPNLMVSALKAQFTLRDYDF